MSYFLFGAIATDDPRWDDHEFAWRIAILGSQLTCSSSWVRTYIRRLF